MSLRLQRVQELLKREIGEIIRRELPVSEAGIISVNDVRITSDLHSATVFVGVLGSVEQVKKSRSLLRKNRILLQTMVARSVILKYSPHLRFVVDDNVNKANQVLQIIDELDLSSPAEVPEPEEE